MQVSKIIIAVLVLAAVAWVVWDQAKNLETDAAPIRYVRTEGVFEYIGKEEVKNALRPLVATGFFTADMQAIKLAVLQMPWVAKVSVKRVWPDAIDIKVYEQKAYARWGDKSLLNERGEIFSPANIDQFSRLPLLNGPPGQEQKGSAAAGRHP